MLNKDEVLRKTNNGLSVFRHYVSGNWRLGRNFLNPLYEDSKASCNVYLDKRSSIYKLKDFGDDSYSGDCFFLVGKLNGFNCSNSNDFIAILRIINRDLSLGIDELKPTSNILKPTYNNLPTSNIMTVVKNRPYVVKEQPMRTGEFDFWMQYGITKETLNLYCVRSIKEFTSENAEGKSYTIKSNIDEPMFGYVRDKCVKIYRPFSKYRFLYGGDIGDCYCFGLEQLPDRKSVV